MALVHSAEKVGDTQQLSKAKSILEEELYLDYLTYSWWGYKVVHTFWESLNLNVNVVEWVQFELVFYDVTVQYVNYNAMETTPPR